MAEIRTNVKRGKGKLKGCLTLKVAYQSYKKECVDKNKKFENWKIFKQLSEEFNKELVKRVIEESETVKLPYRLGTLSVLKKRMHQGRVPKNKWVVDYQKSKELGFIVYFENDYKYYIKWDKKVAITKWKSVYFFKPCRTVKRELAKQIKQGKDYFLK